MRRVDPDLLADIIQRAALQVAADLNPDMGPTGIDTYAQGLVNRDWFRGTVEAAVDAYRHLGGQDDTLQAEEQLARNGGGTMPDLRRMAPGIEALTALRQAGLDKTVDLVWVVPPPLLVGLHWAWGLRVVRSPEATRPTLALQWPPPATDSDETEKGA